MQRNHSSLGAIMPSITVRNVSEEVHRALKVRAAQHGRSAEAEVRLILEQAMIPEQRLRLGDAMAAIARKYKVTDDEVAAIEQARDRTPAEPVDLS
jgi:plasmid stability protein